VLATIVSTEMLLEAELVVDCVTGDSGEMTLVEAADEDAELSVDWLVLDDCNTTVGSDVAGAVVLSLVYGTSIGAVELGKSDTELELADEESLELEADAVEETELLVSETVLWLALDVNEAESVGAELVLMNTGAMSVELAGADVVAMGSWE